MVRSPGSGSLWNWSLVGDLRRHLRRRGPRTRSYPLFLGIRFSRFPGRLAPRPAASFRPRRKEIYYAHPLPRSRGNPAFFPKRGALRAVFAVRPGAIHFDCPSCLAHIPSISPGRALGGGMGYLDVRGREPTKCSRARLTKRARSLGTPSNCRAESFEAKSAEGVGASLYIVAFCHAEIFPGSIVAPLL